MPTSRAFAKLPKATIRFVMSVCPSVRMAPTGPIFMKFDIGFFFRKTVEEFHVFTVYF